MTFSVFHKVRSSAVAAAMGAAVAACGGGGADDAASISTSSGSSSSASALVDTSAGSAQSTVGASTGTSSTDSPSETAASLKASAATSLSSAASHSGAGMNLGTLDTYSPELPTIDLMKRAGAWYVGCQGWATPACKNFSNGASEFDTLEEAKLDLDANGWIKSLPAPGDTSAKYRFASTVLSSGVIPNGTYIVRYDGSGTLNYSGVAAKVNAQSTAGRDVVQVTNSSSGGFFLTLNATDSSNYIRNIRVYPPGGACANDYATFAADATACTAGKGAFVAFESFPSTQPWYPPFVADLKGFRTLRYMDWMKTNSSDIVNWSDRSLPAARTWYSGADGVPVETMIDLSNFTATDPWMNIPTHASDDYVHQFAHLVHQRLSSNLKLNLEYGNETWNYAFTATNWMKDQAVAAWPAEVAKGTSAYTLELDWYAQRLAQICTIAKQEFGSDSARVRCVVNAQAGNTWGIDHLLTCPYASAALGKACSKFVDVVAIAPYFGYYVSDPSYRATVKTWYADADGGLTKLFEELNGADSSGAAIPAPLSALGTQAPSGARALAKVQIVATKAMLDTYGLPMWAYEGGQHLVPPNGDSDTAFLNLITAANRDPRMTATYNQNMADWKAAGGQTFNYYSHVATPSRYGIWGVKESLTDNANPKWKAVLNVRNAVCWWSGC